MDRAVKTLRHEGRPFGATPALMTIILTALVWRLPVRRPARQGRACASDRSDPQSPGALGAAGACASDRSDPQSPGALGAAGACASDRSDPQSPGAFGAAGACASDRSDPQ